MKPRNAIGAVWERVILDAGLWVSLLLIFLFVSLLRGVDDIGWAMADLFAVCIVAVKFFRDGRVKG